MFAEIIRVEFRNEFPDYVYRGTKRKDFTVLSESNCPMVLSENFYYDDYKEVTEILNTKQGRKRIANFHVKAIERVVNELY
jgi:N-acetylmuramoyl-L-alanine amidase